MPSLVLYQISGTPSFLEVFVRAVTVRDALGTEFLSRSEKSSAIGNYEESVLFKP